MRHIFLQDNELNGKKKYFLNVSLSQFYSDVIKQAKLPGENSQNRQNILAQDKSQQLQLSVCVVAPVASREKATRRLSWVPPRLH